MLGAAPSFAVTPFRENTNAGVSADAPALLFIFLHLTAAQKTHQHGQLVQQHQQPAHGVAEGQGFNIHLHHQHKQRSGGDAAAHVQHTAVQGDLQIAHAAEKALYSVGGGGQHIEQGAGAQEPHAQVHHSRVGGKQPDDGLGKQQADGGKQDAVGKLDAHTAVVALPYPVGLARA